MRAIVWRGTAPTQMRRGGPARLCVHMADMLNSSRDTLLELEPTFALVLKLTVATVLTVAEGSDTAEIASLEISSSVF